MQEGGLDLPGCELNAAGIVLILGLLAAQAEWNLPPPLLYRTASTRHAKTSAFVHYKNRMRLLNNRFP